MLRIKLSRVGKKNAPLFRVLVLEKSKDPWGDFLENVGSYNPRTVPPTVALKKERIEYWISQGAQPTDTVHNILVTAGILKDKKRNVSKLGKTAREALKKAKEDAKAAKAAAAAEKAAPAEPKETKTA